MTNQKKSKEKRQYKKNIRKVTWNCKILKNKSKDSNSNFLVMFSSSKASRALELLRKETGWPTDVGHNLWWHMKCAQHTAHNPEFEKMGYSDTPSGGHKKIKGPTHMAEGGHHLRKATNPYPLINDNTRQGSIQICSKGLEACQWGLRKGWNLCYHIFQKWLKTYIYFYISLNKSILTRVKELICLHLGGCILQGASSDTSVQLCWWIHSPQ